MKSNQSILALASLLTVFTTQQSKAAIIVVAPTSSTAGSFQVTTDIIFTVTAAGNGRVFVLDEWVTSDGDRELSSYSPNLSVSINSTILLASASNFADNLANTAAQVTPNDGYFFTANSFSVLLGDTITLHAGTYVLAAAANFNPMASQTFTGNMFVTDGSGNQLSNIVSVPEPSTSGLLLGGVALMILGRSRKK